jgi:hypothetical protein
MTRPVHMDHFFLALVPLDKPVARKCRGCGGGGELPDGGHCNWCAPGEGEPLEDWGDD